MFLLYHPFEKCSLPTVFEIVVELHTSFAYSPPALLFDGGHLGALREHCLDYQLQYQGGAHRRSESFYNVFFTSSNDLVALHEV